MHTPSAPGRPGVDGCPEAIRASGQALSARSTPALVYRGSPTRLQSEAAVLLYRTHKRRHAFSRNDEGLVPSRNRIQERHLPAGLFGEADAQSETRPAAKIPKPRLLSH